MNNSPTHTANRPRFALSRTPRVREAFTLVEMLVVIVIIALLAGMVFGMIKMVGRNADRAKTRRTVELLASAVEEFRAEYGKYPPVPKYGDEQPVTYEYCHKDLIQEGQISGIVSHGGQLFTFGLLSFLMPRWDGAAVNSPSTITDPETGAQWPDHNQGQGDRPRDLRATKRFKPFTDPIVGAHYTPRTAGSYVYTNLNYHVNDAWWQSLKYQSNPPYDSYKLWSVGPDGKDGTSDDIVAGTE